MIELTWIPGALRAAVWLYVLLAATALIFAFTKPKTTLHKALWSTGVVALFAILPITSIYLKLEKSETKRRIEQATYQAILADATSRFKKRCESAGEKIGKVVENVDGIVWMKWRTDKVNFSDQFKLDDPYGTDCYGEECFKRLLRATQGRDLNPEVAKQYASGYRYVETIDPHDGNRYRYIGVIKSIHTRTPDQIKEAIKNSGSDPGPDVYGFALERQPIERYSARYGATWDDISTREDREKWIAGGSMKLIDLKTEEIIAERSGFFMDPGQGSPAGFREPWEQARMHGTICPRIYEDSWIFITKIIQPSKQ